MTAFRAFRIHDDDGQIRAGLEQLTLDDLTEGEVVIRTAYSSVNYKDALAATGKGKILRKAPLVGGVDIAGHVESSSDPRFSEGDAVLVAGCGTSEIYDGGYAEYARIPGDCVMPLPEGLSVYEAMALGTAGLTAALAVQRMQDNGQRPERGPILVTGATGGVGSFAVDMLSGLGFEVAALTGKGTQHDYLRTLGASDIVARQDLEMGTRPLEKARWGGAVDNVGGETLAWLTRTVKPCGNIASVGLAGGITLEITVMPFILRSVNLLGINCVELGKDALVHAWQRLGKDLRPRHLDDIVQQVVELDALPGAFDAYIKGEVTGRTVVKIGG